MSLIDVVDLTSDDDEHEELDVKPIKIEQNLVGLKNQKTNVCAQHVSCQSSQTMSVVRQGHGERRSSNLENNCGNEPGNSQSNGSNRLLTPISQLNCSNRPSVGKTPAPICRQFWKAGTYNDVVSNVNLQNGKNYLQVHPMFLHSNATSHKWAFGAFAELLDNAIDEIQNGATFVSVDKITNPRNGSSALLFQDNGGGMSPKDMGRCMSFGFTDKKSSSSIGRYGNGFKTSTMRLGADVIVFSCHSNESVLTQSIGLLSFTFLRNSGHDNVVVPMVHYEYNTATKNLDFLHGKKHFIANLSLILQWSPYSTEVELLKQFNSIGRHGTKVIIFNLWQNDDGVEELDYSDPKDIRISGETKSVDTRRHLKAVNEQHIGYRYRYSLRAYMSILYLKIPKNFEIVLRGQVVKHHNLADELKYPEYILYKPHSGSGTEAQTITTIGFLKEAPQLNLHGFNVYHKNRLILPFWQVVRYLDNRGRGVVGVLEANFVEPTHNKQDFEKTSLFQKLEARLKEMTWDYWDCHCALIGYQVKKNPPKPQTTSPVTISQMPTTEKHSNPIFTPVALANVTRKRSVRPLSNSHIRDLQGLLMKRKLNVDSEDPERAAKRQATLGPNVGTNPRQGLASEFVSTNGNQLIDQEAMKLKLENQKLREKCLEYEKEEEEFELKVSRLINEIKEIEIEHVRLRTELQALEAPPKQEKDVP